MVFLRQQRERSRSTCSGCSYEGILTLGKIQLGLAKVLAKTAREQHTGKSHHSEDRDEKQGLILLRKEMARSQTF